VVEGPIPARREDVRHHAVQIIENIARSNPQRLEARVGERSISNLIALRPISHRMNIAINFDREPPFEAREIDDISPARILASKAKASGSRTQLLPKKNLRESQRPPQPTSETDVYIRGADSPVLDTHGIGPSTMFHMVPLPVPGRI
jgi:hypothetical protein